MKTSHAPVRVLHVFGRMQPGGAEVRLLELMGRLSPQEFRVDVCALSGEPGLLDDEVRRLGGDVVPVALDARFPYRFIQLLRSRAYDVVHSHVLFTSGVILALSANVGVPIRIAHFHATHDGRGESWRRRVQRRVTRELVQRCATDIIACGEGSMDAIWGTAWREDRRCQVVYDAIDPSRFEAPVDRAAVRARLGVPPHGPLFLHVGNVVAEKNHRRLLDIFAAICRADPSARLVLAGNGTDAASGVVRTAIEDLGLQREVLPLGVRDDVPQLLKAADVLLLPSVREGLPGVVLEACAVGLPVLASDLPGVIEIRDRLPLVHALPLTLGDTVWAAAALALPAQAEQIRLRERAPALFQPTVFHVDRAVEAHRLLWRRRGEVSSTCVPAIERV